MGTRTNKFIISNNPPIYVLNNQTFPWININKISDLKSNKNLAQHDFFKFVQIRQFTK